MDGVKVTDNYQSLVLFPSVFSSLKKGTELLLWDPASWTDPSEDPEQPATRSGSATGSWGLRGRWAFWRSALIKEKELNLLGLQQGVEEGVWTQEGS